MLLAEHNDSELRHLLINRVKWKVLFVMNRNDVIKRRDDENLLCAQCLAMIDQLGKCGVCTPELNCELREVHACANVRSQLLTELSDMIDWAVVP